MRFSKHLAVAGVVALVGGIAAPAIAVAGPGPSWVVQSTPSPGGREGSILLGVSCPSATACTAVGGYALRSGVIVPLAERWNGRKWVVQPTPNPSGSKGSELVGVSCSSAKACTAVGDYSNRSGTFVTLAERWNGRKWAIQATPNPVTGTDGSELLGVSCSSARACTAVGDGNITDFKSDTLAEHWNGTKWAIQPTPTHPHGNESELAGVSCLSATACIAIGNSGNADATLTLAERWNGRKWVVQRTPSPSGTNNPGGTSESELAGVSCSSAKACIAAGDYYNRSGTQVTLAERWNGRKWVVQRTPNPSDDGASPLKGVSCSSATACTVVGVYIKRSGAEPTLAERYS